MHYDMVREQDDTIRQRRRSVAGRCDDRHGRTALVERVVKNGLQNGWRSSSRTVDSMIKLVMSYK